MKYWKVKREYDACKVFPNGVYRSPYYLVGDELLTAMEMDKFKVPDYMVTKVEMPRTRTYIQFGVRWGY